MKQIIGKCFRCGKTIEKGYTLCQECARKLESEYEKQEPCDDAISRQAVLDWLKRVTITDGITFETGFKQILYDIEQMPPVNPQEPKMGYWTRVTDKTGHFLTWECNKCGLQQRFSTNFCPDCGYRMVDPQEKKVSHREGNVTNMEDTRQCCNPFPCPYIGKDKPCEECNCYREADA